MSVSARRASAVTILELLIGVTTITSLTSLLLPALLANREAGRDRQCAYQLGQIGAVLQSYEETHVVLPAGRNLEITQSSGYGWAAAILRQLNEESLHVQIDLGCANEGPNLTGANECEFDSRHYGHVNFAWIDGHTSGISNDIDPPVYRQMAKRR